MAAAALLAAAAPVSVAAAPLGSDAAACQPGGGPAILATIEGLKDRTGRVKLELYPPNDADFTQDDNILIAAGKTFRRVAVPTPPSGPVAICIRVPKPGTYALLFTHDRDAKEKFNPFADGAGVPSNMKIGASKPKAAKALVQVGQGTNPIVIRVQYLRGFGFAPLPN